MGDDNVVSAQRSEAPRGGHPPSDQPPSGRGFAGDVRYFPFGEGSRVKGTRFDQEEPKKEKVVHAEDAIPVESEPVTRYIEDTRNIPEPMTL